MNNNDNNSKSDEEKTFVFVFELANKREDSLSVFSLTFAKAKYWIFE